MPGVADAERRTRLTQEQQQRRQDVQELLRMVQEGRLHEADERQMEMLNLALQLKSTFETSPSAVPQDNGMLDLIKQAIQESLSQTGSGSVGGTPSSGERPSMKHTSLTDLSQESEDLQVSHGEVLGETKESQDDGADKLEKLRKIKGGSR